KNGQSFYQICCNLFYLGTPLALSLVGVHTSGDPMSLQRTVKDTVELVGVGLHSGKSTRVLIQPARINQGVQFVRSDLKGSLPIAAHYKNVVNTQMATSLGRGQVSVSTVEHLMA